MTDKAIPATGRDLGSRIAKVLGLDDIAHIRSIVIDLDADDVATVHVSRFVPVEHSTAICLAFEDYRLVRRNQTDD